MDNPPIAAHSLVEYMSHFSELRTGDQEDGQPSPELLAARFCLTGITSDNSFLAGITVNQDLLSRSRHVPYIRRDLDSVLGYTDNIPVMDAIHYFPHPDLSRTLERRVHLYHTSQVHNEVSTKLIYLFH